MSFKFVEQIRDSLGQNLLEEGFTECVAVGIKPRLYYRYDGLVNCFVDFVPNSRGRQFVSPEEFDELVIYDGYVGFCLPDVKPTVGFRYAIFREYHEKLVLENVNTIQGYIIEQLRHHSYTYLLNSKHNCYSEMIEVSDLFGTEM